ncbi:hypothetical protein P3L10_019848 [Capsicum annuum]
MKNLLLRIIQVWLDQRGYISLASSEIVQEESTICFTSSNTDGPLLCLALRLCCHGTPATSTLLWKNGDKSGGSEQLIEPLLAALSSSSMLSLPPSRRAAAMPCTATFLAPRAGDFNCKFLFETSMELPTLCYWERSTEFIDKFQFNKMWDLCLQGVIIVMQAGGINHR